MGVLKSCKPRKEVLQGDLDDAVFAADFGNLIAGKAPIVYGNAKTFFQNTHPAAQLCKVIETVFERLADAKESGATIRLSTGFGGGKTHTLMALWHLADNIGNPSLGTELLPAAGRPEKVTVVGVDASKAGVPVFAVHKSTEVHSFHGEILFQLGGIKAFRSLGRADDPEASPSESQITSVFPDGPVLILLDELVIYMDRLSERGQGNLLGFLNSLMAVVRNRPQTVLIVTDPAGQVAYAHQATQLGATLEHAAARLDEVFGRRVTDFDPIGNEGARVIVRRLFEKVNPTAAQKASATYLALYQRVHEEQPGLLPASAASADYAQQIVECYPFHPRLLTTAQDRLGALQDFQKSRGILRLFARILRDFWEEGQNIELISAGEINWSSARIKADLLSRLNKDPFAAAISADVEKHTRELDGGASRGIHRRVASALLLESLPLQPNSGLDPADLTLAILRPDDAGHEPSEALDRLVGVCWHTYPMVGGRGWQFRYEPNIIKQIEERMAQISIEDAKSRVYGEVQGYFTGPAFKVTAWPESAKQVPESSSLQLVLCENEQLAKAVCSYSDDTNPQEPMPRMFQNAILAVTANTSAFNEAISRAQRLMAAEQIEREHKTGETGKLIREQLKRVKPELLKQFRLQACRAFDRVIFAGGTGKSLDEQFQVSDEQVMKRAQGQACLRNFLDAKDLIYQPSDALDINRFLKDVLPGTTPLTDNPDVYTAKAVHERFLSAPGLRLIPDSAIVRQSILKALNKGKVVVRLSDGRVYDDKGCVEGPEGARRRIGGNLTSFALDDMVLVSNSKFDTAKQWLQVSDIKEKPGGGDGGPGPIVQPPPTIPSRVQATSWEKIQEYAANRPLLEMHLLAKTPAGAAALASLAQPLGADSLKLEVLVSGNLKDGGMANFRVSDVSLNHPTKPLATAQMLFRAMDDAAEFEADLSMTFGREGRTGLAGQLQTLAEAAPEDVSPSATFDKPIEGTQ